MQFILRLFPLTDAFHNVCEYMCTRILYLYAWYTNMYQKMKMNIFISIFNLRLKQNFMTKQSLNYMTKKKQPKNVRRRWYIQIWLHWTQLQDFNNDIN